MNSQKDILINETNHTKELTFTFGGYKVKTFVNSLNISLSSDLLVPLSPSVRRFKDRGWKKDKK